MPEIPLSQALRLMRVVDLALPALQETFPGVENLLARCEITAIGPVPRFSEEEWERLMAAYLDRQGPL